MPVVKKKENKAVLKLLKLRPLRVNFKTLRRSSLYILINNISCTCFIIFL